MGYLTRNVKRNGVQIKTVAKFADQDIFSSNKVSEKCNIELYKSPRRTLIEALGKRELL